MTGLSAYSSVFRAQFIRKSGLSFALESRFPIDEDQFLWEEALYRGFQSLREKWNLVVGDGANAAFDLGESPPCQIKTQNLTPRR